MEKVCLAFIGLVLDITHGKIQHQDKPRAFLLRKDKKTPLLWQVLANKYQGQVEFASFPDRKGKMSVHMGLEVGEKKVSKVLIYPAGSTNFVVYQGMRFYPFHLC
jgi:protein disulfide-isomerase A6